MKEVAIKRLSREVQKEARRQEILSAAEALIRETGSTDFTMTTLARKSGFSPATPYNLFGTKAAILYALLNRSADSMFGLVHARDGENDVVLKALRASEALADTLVRDPGFYRPLYAFLLGVFDAVYRPAFIARSLQYWMEALEGIDAGKLVLLRLELKDLARLLAIQAIGTIDMWVQDELNGSEVVAQLRQGTCLVLLGIVPPAARAALTHEIAVSAAALATNQLDAKRDKA